ncbi:MAG: peptide deformylase [Rhodospirillales bacterium]
MAILKIARMGHAVLRKAADPVDDPTSPSLRGLVADMLETLADAGGVGLAAPQVHVPLRLMIFFVPESRIELPEDPEDSAQDMTVLVNPGYEPLTEETSLGWEACLSVPGLTGAVPRYTRIRYWGYGLDGARIERRASGFHARVFQHEYDHLDGVLYPQRLDDPSLFGFAEEIRRDPPSLRPA